MARKRTRGTRKGKGQRRAAPKRFLDRVTAGDATRMMKELPDECIDLVFADPPYNLQLPKKRLVRWNRTVVDGVTEEWDKFASFEEYDAFTMSWLTEVKRLMAPSATIWVIGTYHNIYRLGNAMQDLGFWLLNDVIWLKTNPVPNFLKVRFTNATETLIWAIRDRDAKGYRFDKALAKEYGVGKIGANVWEIPVCAGRERLKGKDGKKLHSTQKPERLLERIIEVSSRPGDIVLDPFAGTGTTAAVAKRLGRHFVTFERNKDYIPYIEERLKRTS